MFYPPPFTTLSFSLTLFLTHINSHAHTHTHKAALMHSPPCGSLINDRLSGKWHLRDYNVSGELFNMSLVGKEMQISSLTSKCNTVIIQITVVWGWCHMAKTETWNKCNYMNIKPPECYRLAYTKKKKKKIFMVHWGLQSWIVIQS